MIQSNNNLLAKSGVILCIIIINAQRTNFILPQQELLEFLRNIFSAYLKLPEIPALSAWETKIITDVLISRRKTNACLGNCHRTFLLFSDIFYHVKRLKSTADLNLLVLPRFPWQCPLTLGRNHSAKNISTPITAINHDIFLGLYLNLVPNRRDPSKTFYFYALNSLTFFWLAESVKGIFEIFACDIITAV